MDSVTLALAFYRQPFAHGELLDPAWPLPGGVEELLTLALDARLPDQHALSDAEESRVAARFFVQQVFFVKDASHYRVLGLNPDASEAQIKLHHRLLMRLFHPDRQQLNSTWADNYAQRINEAYTVLRRTEQRQRYDRRLQARRQHRQAMEGVVPEGAGLRSVGIPVPRSVLPPWILRRLPETVLGVVALIAVLSVVGVYLSQQPTVGVSRSPVVEAAAVPNVAPQAIRVRNLPSAAGVQQLRVVGLGVATPIPDTPITPATPALPERILSRIADTQVPVPNPRPVVDQVAAAQVLPPPPVPRARPTVSSPAPVVAVAAASPPVAAVATVASPPVDAVTSIPVPEGGSSGDLSRLDLEVLTSLFVGAYERGDIDAMMALFAEGVSTNDQTGKGGIRQDYQKLFTSTRRRDLRLSGLRWVRRGDNARGQGVFEASVEGDGRIRHFAGTLRFEVQKRGNQALITGFFHRDLYHDVSR